MEEGDVKGDVKGESKLGKFVGCDTFHCFVHLKAKKEKVSPKSI